MEVSASFPDNACLRHFAWFECRIRGALPSGMLSPPGLVNGAAADRIGNKALQARLTARDQMPIAERRRHSVASAPWSQNDLAGRAA